MSHLQKNLIRMAEREPKASTKASVMIYFTKETKKAMGDMESIAAGVIMIFLFWTKSNVVDHM